MINAMYENDVTLIGQVMQITLSHRNLDTVYYEILLRVNRLTDNKYDEIPVLAPEWLAKNIEDNNTVLVHGQIRIYKNKVSTWQRKRVMVLARSIRVLPSGTEHINQVNLIGNINRISPLRYTPLSGRLICDFSICVPRENRNLEDRAYCIAWANGARFVSLLTPGTKVKIRGRIQARTFFKNHSDNTQTQEVVYEVSCFSVKAID